MHAGGNIYNLINLTKLQMTYNHIKKTLRVQRQFMILIVITVAVNVVIYFFYMPAQVLPPAYSLQKTYMSMECSDGRRLGNLMFNYASLIGLCNMYNTTPVMKIEFRLFDIFNLSAAKSIDMQNTLGHYVNYEEYGRRACAYDVGVKKLKAQNTMFHGYFQSYQYFQHVNNLVRKEFTFQDRIISTAKNIHEQLHLKYSSDESNIYGKGKFLVIGIHVRRGDTLEGQYSSYGYTTPDRDYYIMAMKYFEDKFLNVVFVVCSDDKEWSRNNISGQRVTYSDTDSDVIDLAILSLCDHVIISVGSFGWWGAWLANGTTVYYSKWPRPVSILEYMVTKRHYFYSDWIPLP